VTAIRSRKADGAVANPVVLLEGEEGAGKTTELVKLSRSPRVGQLYGIEIGETRLNEYGGLLPGADVEIIDHDGSYIQILDQIIAVKAEAQRAKDAGEPPVVLGIDSFTFLWNGLKDWVNWRARQSNANKTILAKDPAAEITIGRHLWNDADTRYYRIQNNLLTFPGIVIVTARGKWVSATDPRTGHPFKDGRKDYSVECNKALPHAAGTWVRLTRDGDPQLVACKSGHMGVKYEKGLRGGEVNTEDLQVPRNVDLLEHLIFEMLRYDPAKADTDQLRVFSAGGLMDEERAADPEEAQQAAPRRLRSADAATPPLGAMAARIAAHAVTMVATEAIGKAYKAAGTHVLDTLVTPDAVGTEAWNAVGAGPKPVQLRGWLSACAECVKATGRSVAKQVEFLQHTAPGVGAA
jgi:hypothetical protein